MKSVAVANSNLLGGKNPPGVSADRRGQTPLHLATLDGHLSAVELLLQQPETAVNVNAQDTAGRTPLHCAVRSCQGNLVRLLSERGADPTLPDSAHFTPLHEACAQAAPCSCLEQGHECVCNILLLVKLLVSQVLSAEAVNHLAGSPDGTSPLRLAPSEEYVRKFISGRTITGETALHLTARKGAYFVVCFLLECKATVKTLNYSGRGPLEDALKHGHNRIVQTLLEANADVTHDEDEIVDRQRRWMRLGRPPHRRALSPPHLC